MPKLLEKDIMGRIVPPSLLDEPPKGKLRLAVVGEAPGEWEQYEQTPFVGQSGKLLRATLRGLGHADDYTYFTNVANVRPEDNRDLFVEEIKENRERVFQEIASFHPDRLLLLGVAALNAFFGEAKCNLPMIAYRGVFTEWQGIETIATFHPAMILREPSAYVDLHRDISKILTGAAATIPPPTTTHVLTTEQSALKILREHIQYRGSGDDGVRVIDIETTGFNPKYSRCLSIGISPSPLPGHTPEDVCYILPDAVLYSSQKVISALRSVFFDIHLKWVGHNAIIFDAPFLLTALNLPLYIEDDTMLMHYTLDERPGKQFLKVNVSDYFGLPDYSKDAKKYLKEEGATFENIPREVLYEYQGKDCIYTYRLYKRFQQDIAEEPIKAGEKGLRYALDNILYPAAEFIGDTIHEGILIDRPHMEGLETQWKGELATLDLEIKRIAGSDSFNPASVPQMRKLLFETLKLRKVPIKLPKQGIIDDSTCKRVLETLEPEDSTGFITTLLKRRNLAIFVQTFVTGLLKKVEEDGRLRPRLLLHGTETGRLSSRGPNIQNIPKHDPKADLVRYGFMATPDHCFLELDYSQLEYRCAAWYSRDEAMIDAFVRGLDFHLATAALLFNVALDKVEGWMRQAAKSVNFGILYGMGAKALAQGALKWTFSDTTPCTEKQAQEFIDRLLGQFPGLADYFAWVHKGLKGGYLETPYGRRRHFPLLTKQNFGDLEREAKNSPIQSMASDICLSSAIRINKEIPHSKGRVRFLVHDSVFMEVRQECVAEVQPQVIAIMQNPFHLIEDRGVPFTVKPEILQRWGKMPVK